MAMPRVDMQIRRKSSRNSQDGERNS